MHYAAYGTDTFNCRAGCGFIITVLSFQNTLPAISLKLPDLVERLKAGYKAFTVGNFAESRQEFDYIITAVPLVVGESRAEGNQLKEVQCSLLTPRPLLLVG